MTAVPRSLASRPWSLGPSRSGPRDQETFSATGGARPDPGLRPRVAFARPRKRREPRGLPRISARAKLSGASRGPP